MELMNRLNNNLRRLQANKARIESAKQYINGLAHAQSRPFAARGMGGLGFQLEVAGYDFADADTYRDAWNYAGEAADSTWAWLEDGLNYVGDGVTDVWDRLGEQLTAMKQGFTTMLDIAYVTADGVAELWALYKWVGGPSEMLDLKRQRDRYLMRKKDNPLKYGPFYLKANQDGSKPPEMPTDATNAQFISLEQADAMNDTNPDFMGTHSIVGLPQATWKYYLGGYDGITPDWRNPLHYPNAVLYWYYDAQIEKMEAIAADFDKSALGRSRDWLFERGTLLKAWMAGGWDELFNMKQIVEQNYRVAKAKTDLLGHEAVANVQGAMLFNKDGETEQSDSIEVLGIKSSKQVALEKIQKLRMMFPYNARAFMSPQMWFTMHDFRQKKADKASTPYPLIMLDDKIQETDMSSLTAYLKQTKDSKIREAQIARENGIGSASDEMLEANTEYNDAMNSINSMPMIFVEGMMSAFGGRAGPFYSLDADKQFGDFVWANSDAFAIDNKPDRPAGIRPFWSDENMNPSIGAEVGNAWLTGSIGNTLIQREAWLNAQPAFSLRGWGFGTQIFTPADPASGEFGYANFGHFFDWHPFNALWCHDGETHMGGQYSFLHNAVLNSQDTADFSVLQSDLDGAYMSDYWTWNESLRIKPLYMVKQSASNPANARQIELRDTDFLIRRNRSITDFANSGVALTSCIPELPPMANMRSTSDASKIVKNDAVMFKDFVSVEGNSGANAYEAAVGVFGAASPDGAGLYSLNFSPVQSIFAVGSVGSNVKSIWSATTGKSLAYGPAIGHGKKVRLSRTRTYDGLRIGGNRYVAGLTNYHTVTTIGYNPYAVTADRNYRFAAGIEGSYAQRSYLFEINNIAGRTQMDWLSSNILANSSYPAVDREGNSATSPGMAFGGPVDKGVMDAGLQRSINWATLGGSAIGGAEITTPGFSASNWQIGLGEVQTFLIAGVTPPVETVSQTGLSPRPGLYASTAQSGAVRRNHTEQTGFGRFPGGHYTNFVGLGNRLSDKGIYADAGYDYTDPLFASILTMDVFSGTGPAQASQGLRYMTLNPIRKVASFGAIENLEGFAGSAANASVISNLDQPNLIIAGSTLTRNSAGKNAGIFDFGYSGIKTNRTDNSANILDFLRTNEENASSSSTFNYARLTRQNIGKFATALKHSWERKSEFAHMLLAVIINEVLAGRRMTRVDRQYGSPTNAFSLRSTTVVGENTYGLKYASGADVLIAENGAGAISPDTVAGWSVQQITQALNSEWLVGSNKKLYEGISLAEPDSNPMGVWFETTQSDHEFFGITDMTKFKENSELILNGEQMKLMTAADLWNFHRALANKDKTRLTPDVVDWFNSKVTKYGWCHIMQGATPVRLDKMKQPVEMPRFWAPLFVPFRPISDFAPRVYLGTDKIKKELYRSTPIGVSGLAGNASGVNDLPSFRQFDEIVWDDGSTTTKSNNLTDGRAVLTNGTMISETAFIPGVGEVVYGYVQGFDGKWSAYTITKGSGNSELLFAGEPAVATRISGFENNKQTAMAAILDHAANNDTLEGINGLPYWRNEFEGVAPHATLDDDIRLHDSFRLVAKSTNNADWDEGQADLDGIGGHWASQYSWLNCGWFGFESAAEAQMFMKLQFDTQSVSFEGASYEWKGMLNGPPTGTIGFGPIDDLIDFVRYFDSMIMSKIDIERAYLSALRRYESMKIRFDKMAQFKIDLVNANIDDIRNGVAKVIPTGNAKPKTYRWLPVFAYADNGLARLHPDNAEAIFMMMEAQPNEELSEITETEWPAATTSPSKFVAGAIIEQQIDNNLSEDAEWDFVTYIATQGRQTNNESVKNALAESGFPSANEEAFLPWFVGGRPVCKKVDIVGGVFKQWEHMLTSDNSPLGKFLNKMRLYNQNIEMLWNGKLPGFSLSMKEFWSTLGEDNTVISDFIGDVVDLFKNARADYGQVASSVVNINDKIETYLDNFEKMSINWSNSIEAMNKYADYMAKNLYSLNQKFNYALDRFQQPYQTFQDVITSEESPLQFEELVAALDKVFNKNNRMTSVMGNKMAFGNFKDIGGKTRMNARDVINGINASGLAQIEVATKQQKPLGQAEIIKPWLQLPPPPHIDLNFRVPSIRSWISEEVDPTIEGGWAETEFFPEDLPSANIAVDRPSGISTDLIDPVMMQPRSREIDEFAMKNYDMIAAARITIPSRNPFDRTPGNDPYSTYPAGQTRKMTGVGPNGEVFDTYFGEEPPAEPQIGDKWMNAGRVFVWDGEQWLLEQQFEMIDDFTIENGAVLDPSEIIDGGSELIVGGEMVELPPEGDTSSGGTNTEIEFKPPSSGTPSLPSLPKPSFPAMSGVLRGPLAYRR